MNFTMLLILLPFVVLYIWYATIVARRNKANEALSGIDVQLQKRGELIPNILKIAQRFMSHERDLLTEITELREKSQAPYDKTNPEAVKQHIAAAEQLALEMGKLMVRVEQYPDLKSQDTMVQAQKTYNEVEQHIAAARRFYNSAVTDLNNSIEIFPGSFLAGFAGARVMPFYKAPEHVKAPVDADIYLN